MVPGRRTRAQRPRRRSRREAPGVPPQVVVSQFLGRRRLETVSVDTLRVHTAHHVADRAVLASRVDSLEHDKDSVGLLRGQAVLVFREQFRALLEKPFPIPFIAHTASLAWVKALRQRDLRAWPDPQGFDEPGSPAGVQLSHPRPPARQCSRPFQASRPGRRSFSSVSPRRLLLHSTAVLLRPLRTSLLACSPFCGVEGLECLAGGVVVGAGAEGGADAISVELLAHWAVDGADGEADVSFAEVLDDAGDRKSTRL